MAVAGLQTCDSCRSSCLVLYCRLDEYGRTLKGPAKTSDGQSHGAGCFLIGQPGEERWLERIGRLGILFSQSGKKLISLQHFLNVYGGDWCRALNVIEGHTASGAGPAVRSRGSRVVH